MYHQPQKNLQFIKEYQFAYIPVCLQQQVVKNAVVCVMIEIVLHTIKQQEANEPLYNFLQQTIEFADAATPTQIANLPIAFCLQWSTLLGFEITSIYSEDDCIFDLVDGSFTSKTPNHIYYVEGELAKIIFTIIELDNFNQLEDIKLNKMLRKQLLEVMVLFLRLHVEHFGNLKSIDILTTILA